MAITKRLVKGSPLTAQEFDGNLDEIEKNAEDINALQQSQNTSTVAYATFADLPVSGSANVLYRITNDSTSSNNGYWTWDGASYVKAAETVVQVIDQNNTSDSVSGKAVYDWKSSIDSIQTFGDNALNGTIVGEKWIVQREGTTTYNTDHFEITTGTLTYSGANFTGVEARRYYVEFDMWFISGTPGRSVLIGDGTSSNSDNIVLTTEIKTTKKRFSGFVTLSGVTLGFYQLEAESGNVYGIGNVFIDSNYSYYEKRNEPVNENKNVNQLISTGDNQLTGTLVGGSIENRRSGVLSYNTDHFELATGNQTYTGLNYTDIVQGQQYYVEVDLWLISGVAGRQFFVGNGIASGVDTYEIKNISNTRTTYKFQVTPSNTEIGFYQALASTTEVYGIGNLKIYKVSEDRNIDTTAISVKDGESNLYNNYSLKNSFTWAGAGLNAKMLTYKHYLFITEYNNYKVRIYDLRNNHTPTLVNSFTVSASPRDLKVINGFLFVSCYNADKIEVYDISNLTSTSLIHTISDVSRPKAITVIDNYLYVVNSGTSTLRKYEIETLSNPTVTITFINEVTSLGTTILDADFNGVDQIGVCGLNDTIQIIDKNDSSKRTLTIATAKFSTGRFLNKNIFVACDRENGVLYFIDISQTTPFVLSQLNILTLGEEITIIGNRIYIPELSNATVTSKLMVIDITNVFKPLLLSSIDLTVSGAGFTAFRNGYLYVNGHFSPFNIDVVKCENGEFDNGKNVYNI